MTKIRYKIIAVMSLLSIFVSVTVGMITIYKSSSYIYYEANQKLLYQNKAQAKNMDELLSRVEIAVNNLDAFLAVTFNLPKAANGKYIGDYQKQLDAIVLKCAQRTTGSNGAYIYLNVDLTKGVYGSWYTAESEKPADSNAAADSSKQADAASSATTDNNSEHGYIKQELGIMSEFTPENKDMVWYYKPISEKKGVWLDPYVDSVTKELIVSYVKPVYSGEILIGVAGIDMSFGSLVDLVNGVNENEYSSMAIFVLDRNLDFLVHDRFTLQDNLAKAENGAFSKIADKLRNNESGIERYSSGGERKTLAYSRLSNGYIFCTTVSDADMTANVSRISRALIVYTAIVLLASLSIAYTIGNRIAEPIMSVSSLIEKIGDLNFVSSKSEEEKLPRLLRSRDETGIIARAVIKTRDAVRDMIRQIRLTSDDIHESSKRVEELLKFVKSDLTSNFTATRELSAGMQQASASALVTTEAVVSIRGHISDISDRMQNASLETETIQKRAAGLRTTVTMSQNEAERVYEDVRGNLETAMAKVKSVEKIDTLAQTISAIARQTNLLSLNAMIAAAHAGEHGKSFTVVAREITNLAEQTSAAVKDIRIVVKDIHTSVSELSGGASQILGFIDTKVLDDYKSLIDVAEQYDRDAESMHSTILDCNSTLKDIFASIGDIASAVNEVSATIQKGAKGVEDIGNNSSDILEQAEHVMDTYKHNVGTVEEMVHVVSKVMIE